VTWCFSLLGFLLRLRLGWRLRHTRGFTSSRSGHFEKHVLNPATRSLSRLRVPTEEVYELLADRFVGRRRHAKLHEGVVSSKARPLKNGRLVRYDERTEEFVVVLPDGGLMTYYKPSPRSAKRPNSHRFDTNLEYFHDTLLF
jgi:hypothetical protein